ncbi:FliA/WhiG family RNA polymerase sigma factor [Clostridium thermobutyricum]|uniref:RNA polymerase sigma-D factor n=1 Tax=Clostridium thermobutyricum DSM 4928 TaxID=1121339 RepID=A0A1V4SNF6_9CLOT|nr:FliA/WhiG family RNA polymerase sigma factor [Clostridium thermobutyricum]OPX45333.1 RNA polymerase sigma-D factor [Clostridium thermobutyricum DSM 4928]
MATLESMDVKKHIVEEYIPLVKYIASRVSIGRNKTIEYDDLVGYGMIGLMDAINRYDETKGMKFSSYASIRIKGSMIDELRKHRPISKGAMDKLKTYNEGIEFLQNKLLREPTTEEISKYLNISIQEIFQIEGYINLMAVISLDNLILGDEDEMAVMNTIEDKNCKTPEEEYLNDELEEILKESIDELKEKDKIILNLYYYEELTLKEIGKILNISESRVCQIHSRALRNLKSTIKNKFDIKV